MRWQYTTAKVKNWCLQQDREGQSLGIRLERVRSSIGIALILSAGMLITLTLLAVDPVGSALCGVEDASVTNALDLMPAYFIMMIIGIGNNAKPYVRLLLKKGFNQQDLKRLFLALVVSGGSIYRRDGKYCLRYYGKDICMHGVFGDLAYQIYSVKPQTVRIESRGTYMSQLYSKFVVLELGEFSPELASRKGEVPTISYILEGDRRVRIEAARVVMSTSGWITCTFCVPNGLTRAYPRLGLGSVLGNNLVEEYSNLMETIPLRMSRYDNIKYRQTGYLATTDQEEMESFLQVGGFLDGSTVKKGAFSGLEKSRLLQAMVRTRGTEFDSKQSAIKLFTRGCDEATIELSLYLERLKLG